MIALHLAAQTPVVEFTDSLALLQLRLPIHPPMNLLASNTSQGMLGLRWSKIKLGSGAGANTKTVQASCNKHSDFSL